MFVNMKVKNSSEKRIIWATRIVYNECLNSFNVIQFVSWLLSIVSSFYDSNFI